MINKFFSTKRLSIKHIIFNLVTIPSFISSLLSTFISYIIGLPFMQIIVCLCVSLTILIGFYIANYKNDINLATVFICCIDGMVFFPAMYFTGGGIHSGTASWMLLFLVFSIFILEGKVKYPIIIALCLDYIACFFIEYKYPFLVTRIESREAMFLDIFQSMIFVIIWMLIIVKLQQNLFINVNKIYKKMAYRDEMTSLFNQAAFYDELRRMNSIDIASTVIMIVDMNNLKYINDNFGHVFGDDAIKQISAILLECFQENYVCYRIGGDEFAVIGSRISPNIFEIKYNEFCTKIKECNKNKSYPFSAASSYAYVKNNDVKGCIREADKGMYIDKKRTKKKYF